ncbi:MAG TPA: alpha/beta hydrolase [Streptosporangiaceae bacterium]|nr:alpha/beta hydrolase [Streptosporangiaceae bacterium]
MSTAEPGSESPRPRRAARAGAGAGAGVGAGAGTGVWRSPRFRRFRRRAGITIVGIIAAVTAASFGYNLATDGPAPRPSGLRLIKGGGFDTRYRGWGTTGSPIVLIPGAFETADAFSYLGPVLGATHRVYAIDLTGTGYSAPSPPYDVTHLADQVLAFIRAMHLTGPNAPILVGHSSGAAVAGMAALADPGSVSGVVFVDGDALPLAFPPLLGWLLINPYRTSLVRLGVGSDAVIKRVYQSQCGPTCAPLSAAGVRAWRLPLQQPAFLDVIAFNLRHGIPAMTYAQLRALKAESVPKLVIYGRDDPQLSPAGAAATAVRIGAPPPVAVPGRHLPIISSTRQVTAAIEEFIRRQQ